MPSHLLLGLPQAEVTSMQCRLDCALKPVLQKGDTYQGTAVILAAEPCVHNGKTQGMLLTV